MAKAHVAYLSVAILLPPTTSQDSPFRQKKVKPLHQIAGVTALAGAQSPEEARLAANRRPPPLSSILRISTGCMGDLPSPSRSINSSYRTPCCKRTAGLTRGPLDQHTRVPHCRWPRLLHNGQTSQPFPGVAVNPIRLAFASLLSSLKWVVGSDDIGVNSETVFNETRDGGAF